MLDIKFIRENPDVVKENIKKKFQDEKLPLVDEVIELDAENRAAIAEAQRAARRQRNTLSKQIGMLMGQAKKDPSKLAGGRGRQGPGQGQRRPAGASWRHRRHELADGDPQDHAGDPQHHRPLRAHRPGRLLQCGGSALRRGQGARLRRSLPHRHHGVLQRH